jgi:hypothetical protein
MLPVRPASLQAFRHAERRVKAVLGVLQQLRAPQDTMSRPIMAPYMPPLREAIRLLTTGDPGR